jgi:beta-lactamase regulating signal transducer with metallopeptidase domain
MNWINTLNWLADAWWPQIWHGAWQAALVAAALLLVVRFGRRWPAALRYGIVSVALLKFLFPPLVAFPGGIFSQLPWAARLPAAESSNTAAAAMARIPPAEGSQAAGFSAGGVSTRRATRSSLTSGSRERTISWKAWLMALHALGAAVLLGCIARQACLLARLRARSQPVDNPKLAAWLAERSRQLGLWRRASLRVSREVDSPLAFGVLRPTVLLPPCVLELPRRDVETVLVHELAHLRRGDAWMSWLQVLVCAIWWFHPLAWITGRALRRIREDCCDDLLLLSGVTTESDYCNTLLRVAAHVPSQPAAVLACGMAERLHPLGDRLTRILDHQIRRSSGLSGLAVIGLTSLACVVLPGLATVEGSARSGILQLAGSATTAVRSPVESRSHWTRTGGASEQWHEATPDLSGTWQLRLPSGYQHTVTFERLDELHYRLTPSHFALAGIYELRGERLVIVEPDDRRLTEFEWLVESPQQLRLLEPAVAENGGRYRGAVLLRPGWEEVASAGGSSLAGRWRMTLPAGFEHEVTLISAGKDRYHLLPMSLSSSGLYEVRADRLVLMVPNDPRPLDFQWQIEGHGRLVLIRQPELSTIGSNYLGGSLTRLP